MITIPQLARFLAQARDQAEAEGRRYAGDGRVGGFVGSSESVTTVVRGQSGDFEVALWSEQGRLAHRCSCPSWRNPCKHQVAAAIELRRALAARRTVVVRPPLEASRRVGRTVAPAAPTATDPDAPRRAALAGRIAAARRESFTLSLDQPPALRIRSASGFDYRVALRGDADGPHGCDCPDFEANRLHTCKHVERVRAELRSSALALPPAHRDAARRARVFLHFGELVEPRWLIVPGDEPPPSRWFDAAGLPLQPLAREERETLAWLAQLGPRVEPAALAWLEARTARRPALPELDFRRLVPELPLEPYPYQWQGAAFLARAGRALLADEMGLGKTLQALLAAVALRSAREPVRAVAVVCPASLRAGWQDEIRRWLGEPAELLAGGREARAVTIAERPAWLVTHYEQLVRDLPAWQTSPPDLLVVDEAQRAKGLATRTARALKSIPARYLFALTGTPLENRLEEAYAIAQLVDQRLLPPLWQIERDHLVRDERRRVVLYRNLDALRSRLAPAFLRRRKEDVALELPERIRTVRRVPLEPAAAELYDDVLGRVRRLAARASLAPADLERLRKLLVLARRACDGAHLVRDGAAPEGSPKLEELEHALRALCLGEGRKAVVFSEWAEMTAAVEALCRRLELPVFHLTGAVPVGRRAGLVRGFTEHVGPAVFASTDAGGSGLNLQAADVVASLDLPWNPARLEQRLARVHRIGARRAVTVLLLVARNTIEGRMLELHESKRSLLESVWSATGADQLEVRGGASELQAVVRAALGPAPPGPAATSAGGGAPAAFLAPLRRSAAALPASERCALATELRALAAELDPGRGD